MMNLATILEEILGTHNDLTEDDIRQAFGDYHNLLHWLTWFLSADEKLADSYIVDACTIAETQTAVFHEWLVQWGARATVKCAFDEQRAVLQELSSRYEQTELVHSRHVALSKEDFLFLVTNSEEIRVGFDLLCRFVLLLCGIAKVPYDEVAAQLGISRNAVERAYCAAVENLEAAADRAPCSANPSPSEIGNQPVLAKSSLCDA